MSTYSEFSKGSEWRKWDLHFHTPASDDYKNQSITAVDIVKGLNEKGISVVVITDHNIISQEWIQKIRDEAKSEITVLPGIELRTSGGGATNIHLIGIFDENSNIGTEDISGQIKLQSLMVSLEISDKISKGVKAEEIYVDMTKAIKEIHKLNGIVSIHAGHKHSGIETISHALPHKEAQKRDVAEKVDIFEVSAIRDAEDYKKIVFPEIKRIKPIIIGSDNHDALKYYEEDDIFTWIKADPTFEGLKQIIYEPEGRVKIQASNPNIKKSYNIIEKVKFVDNSSSAKFTNYEIGFNPDLNAIIGGKSSGKSLLLHSIAKTVGYKSDNKNYESILNKVELEVYYADEPDKKRTPEDLRIIEFLPQLHIERIVREKSQKVNRSDSQNYFDNFVEELIRQEDDIKEIYEKYTKIIDETQDRINNSIRTWIMLDRELSTKEGELKPLGDKKAISNEIDKIQNNIENLKKRAGLSDDEMQLYNHLIGSNNECNLKTNQWEERKSEIKNMRNYIAGFVFDGISAFFDFETTDNYTQNLFKYLQSNIKNLIEKEIDDFLNVLTTKERKIEYILFSLNKKIERNNQELSPILAKNKIKDEIDLLEENTKKEKAKKEAIIQKEKEIVELKKKRDEITFIDDYKKIMDSYIGLATSINSNIGEKWIAGNKNLVLTATSVFDTFKFHDSLSSVINMQSYLENQFSNCGFKASDYIFNDDHVYNIAHILSIATSDEKRFNNFKISGNTEELLYAILKDYNYIDFDIKKSGDSLQNMSEGKKGIVILQLYLSLSKSDCPILIDQPEDNLDNRTVYIELNNYIKQCKQRRQIIMVSHNANLVVNTDAENVIVANQAGEDGKDNKEYKFEYVNGALESTFDKPEEKGVLYQKGIREHVCEILEGGTDAFKKREEKYNLR
jgi:energy-coupling factor transporter ATP-binding protein EcfA2